MKRVLTWTCILIFHWTTLDFIDGSIAGVTYMDNFDFEQRYRDVNECNPLYWHPLHLPDKCMKMFDNLIRSRLAPFSPYRVAEERANVPEYEFYLDDLKEYSKYPEPVYEVVTMSLFEILFEYLEKDVKDNPSSPDLAFSPNLGVMALYKQPVSYKSVAMIKKIARFYSKQRDLIYSK
ncbi:uncharacterized protein LOC124543253 [Vanessa cardui]|uniref:uncharacterized protein LOC124543253 n=1 Tax=Vanessa cardui TaxID=171605 RepID=UPI001F148193|nr:uncharacterized protein LOC124543253 [Vanessa cardui]